MINKKPKYPTKNEIIDCKTTPTKYDIKTTKKWKKDIWNKNEETKEKIERIKFLLEILLKKYNKKTTIKFNPKLPTACYSKKYDIIILNNCSIISALHELGHAIYGRSELKACSWSTKLFQYSFPIAFNKLTWKGHQLVKK
jgi:hypothetical protein